MVRLVKFFFCLFSWMISLLSTIIQIPLSIFKILWNCSETFLKFLESLVCDFLNFINKYIIVRNTIFSTTTINFNITNFLHYRFITFSNTLTRFFLLFFLLYRFITFSNTSKRFSFRTDLSIVTQFCFSSFPD